MANILRKNILKNCLIAKKRYGKNERSNKYTTAAILDYLLLASF